MRSLSGAFGVFPICREISKSGDCLFWLTSRKHDVFERQQFCIFNKLVRESLLVN